MDTVLRKVHKTYSSQQQFSSFKTRLTCSSVTRHQRHHMLVERVLSLCYEQKLNAGWRFSFNFDKRF
ncbi:hypothetical protein Hamer_G012199 [Homarus americanus]|uniref:Uncharacterized protein n=1 Tax=Homarus americanus TaxID=6706 RepID=A0A8J5KA27_HOMAM|nr:hypothetical protein Hamer_G012199 [Homarus americanus]